MAFSKKYFKKKNTKSRARKNKLYKSMQVGLPRTNIVKLRYVSQTTINAGVGNIASHVIRANGLYDPTVAVGGHQPLGFDEWSQLYSNYTVIGSRCKVTASTGATTSNYGPPAMIGIMLSSDTSLPTSSLVNAMEQGRTVFKPVAEASTKGSDGVVLTKSFSAKKFFGVNNIKDNQDDLGALISADPARQAYFKIAVGSLDASTDPEPINIVAVIDYIVMFTTPKFLAES